MLTCTGVSYAHGSNDGQKGMGLIMLILVGLVPGAFALNMATSSASLQGAVTELREVVSIATPLANGTTLSADDANAELSKYVKPSGGKATEKTFAALAAQSQAVADALANVTGFDKLSTTTKKRSDPKSTWST